MHTIISKQIIHHSNPESRKDKVYLWGKEVIGEIDQFKQRKRSKPVLKHSKTQKEDERKWIEGENNTDDQNLVRNILK